MHQYLLSTGDFADFLGITTSRLLALIKHLGLDEKKEFSVIIKNKRYYTLEAIQRVLKHRGFVHPKKWISILNLKGGVGKTTIALALAYYLAKYGGRVLLIDLDPQSNATNALTGRLLEIYTISDLVTKKVSSKEAVVKTKHGFDLIPSKLGDTSFEQVLLHQVSCSPTTHKDLYKKVFADIADDYDYIIFDAPPNVGRPVYLAASCSDTVVIPVVADDWAIEGLELTMSSIREAEEAYGKKIDIKVVINKFDGREMSNSQYIEMLRSKTGISLMRTFIRTNTPFKKIQSGNFLDSIVNKKNTSAHDVSDFVHELIPLEIPKPKENN